MRLVAQEFFHFLLQVFTGLWIHQAELLLIYEHGLLRQPFLPGLQGNGLEDFLALGTGIGWRG